MKTVAVALIAIVSTFILCQLGVPDWAMNHLRYGSWPVNDGPYPGAAPAPRVPRQQQASTTVGGMVAASTCCCSRAGQPLVIAPEEDKPVSIPADTPATDLGNGKLRIEYTGPDGLCTIYVIDRLP